MAYIYAMSDMHGDMEAFKWAMSVVNLDNPDNMVVFCGDYMPPPDGDFTLIREIMKLQKEHPNQVVALMGNHEDVFVEEYRFTDYEDDPAFVWMKELPYYYETENQIFVHAGIDEEAGDLWKLGTPNDYFCNKFPWSEGKFLKDIIAGHTGTWNMAGDENFHDVYWDGASHYYLDGTVQVSHKIPVLKYDTKANRYTAFTFDDEGIPEEYELMPPVHVLQD